MFDKKKMVLIVLYFDFKSKKVRSSERVKSQDFVSDGLYGLQFVTDVAIVKSSPVCADVFSQCHNFKQLSHLVRSD